MADEAKGRAPSGATVRERIFMDSPPMNIGLADFADA